MSHCLCHEGYLSPMAGGHFISYSLINTYNVLPWWLSSKESTCRCMRDTGLIPGLGRSPGEGDGNPLQYSCLGNPMDRRARWARVHEVAKETRLNN